MKLSDLKQAKDLAGRYGVKSIVYGSAGSGKTPLVNTAPRPVLVASEPGLLSMRSSSVPTFQAETPSKIGEFFKWVFESAETKNFDTICVDSISNIAEIYLADSLAREKHGMKAYGRMSEIVYDLANRLFYLKEKHVVLLAKETTRGNGRQTLLLDGKMTTETVMQKVPYFPGKDLNVKIPYLFDNVLHIGQANVPGQAQPVRALRTRECESIFARERAGVLNELEQPDLDVLFKKSLGY